jgi:hypothetical protein
MATAFRIAGWIRGAGLNLDLVYRFVEGQSGQYAALAGDLVRLPVDVTVTWGYACQPCCEGSEQWRFRLSPDLRV